MRILLLAVTLVFAASASAQPAATGTGNWPSRAIHMIVPFPAGSSPDLIARVLSEKLASALGQPVVVENRLGAGGNLGTALIARAAPDGYTIGLSIPGPLAVNTVLYKKMEYDPFKDLAPVSLVGASPNVLVVDPKLNVNSVREFVARPLRRALDLVARDLARAKDLGQHDRGEGRTIDARDQAAQLAQL